MSIEQELKQRRLSMNLNQSEFAKHVKIDSAMVSAYEIGRSNVGNRTLAKINKALGTEYKIVRECMICGEPFYPMCPNGKCCPKHSNNKKYRAISVEVVPRKKHIEPVVPLGVANEQARQQRKTYGQLQAERYLGRIKEA